MNVDLAPNSLNFREQKQIPELIRQLALNDKIAHLVSLNLEYSDLDDETLAIIGDNSTSLTQLNLNVCQQITDSGIEMLVKKITSLTELSLYWNVKLSDSCVERICRTNSNLTSLTLSGCKQVTDVGLDWISNNCKNLILLDLTRCPKISDKGLQNISEHCTSLRTLLLYASSGFGDVGVAALVSSLHRLEIFDLCGTGQLSDQVCKTSFPLDSISIKIQYLPVDAGTWALPNWIRIVSP